MWHRVSSPLEDTNDRLSICHLNNILWSFSTQLPRTHQYINTVFEMVIKMWGSTQNVAPTKFVRRQEATVARRFDRYET